MPIGVLSCKDYSTINSISQHSSIGLESTDVRRAAIPAPAHDYKSELTDVKGTHFGKLRLGSLYKGYTQITKSSTRPPTIIVNYQD